MRHTEMRTKLRTIVFGSLLAVASVLAFAQDETIVDFEQSPALHFPVGIGGKSVAVVPAFEDYAFMMFDACDAMGLSKEDCMIYPMNAELGGNAIATMLDGNRVIVYDRELSPIVGSTGAMAIIAHELGHHYCGHIGTPADPLQELEADRFAGAALRNEGISLADALAMAKVFDDRPSLSHPAKADKIKAIEDGWNNPFSAKNC